MLITSMQYVYMICVFTYDGFARSPFCSHRASTP
jgi:hypothetical protein